MHEMSSKSQVTVVREIPFSEMGYDSLGDGTIEPQESKKSTSKPTELL